MKRKNGFTLIELLVVIAIIALLIGILLPSLAKARNAGRLGVSLSNVRQILVACGSYRHEQKDGLPIRLSYTYGGTFGGMDTWSYGGKNNNAWWVSGYGGVFDEPAYARFLNPYVYQDMVLEKPPGYQGYVGTGATQQFFKGTLTAAQRDSFQMNAFRSPGDKRTYQRNWPTGDPTISSYDDVGTSYHINLRWLQPLSGGNFVTQAAYNEGVRRMRLVEAFDPKFVWLHDQTADVCANADYNVQPLSARRNWMGEYGEYNKSVMGFFDGRAEYILMKPGELRGEKYNFLFKITNASP